MCVRTIATPKCAGMCKRATRQVPTCFWPQQGIPPVRQVLATEPGWVAVDEHAIARQPAHQRAAGRLTSAAASRPFPLAQKHTHPCHLCEHSALKQIVSHGPQERCICTWQCLCTSICNLGVSCCALKSVCISHTCATPPAATGLPAAELLPGLQGTYSAGEVCVCNCYSVDVHHMLARLMTGR